MSTHHPETSGGRDEAYKSSPLFKTRFSRMVLVWEKIEAR